MRLCLGWVFLWPFFDKLFGLGFAVQPENAWINGGSPTAGFLTYGTKGPLAEVFQSLAGLPFVDWLFMIGLLLIGLSLILGIGIRIASYSGALLLVLMWFAAMLPEHNPFLDDHIIYAIILVYLAVGIKKAPRSGAKWWQKLSFVKKNPWLM